MESTSYVFHTGNRGRVEPCRSSFEVPAEIRLQRRRPLAGEIVGCTDPRPPGCAGRVDILVQNRAASSDVIQAQAEVQRQFPGGPLILNERGRALVVALDVVSVAVLIVRNPTVGVDVEAGRPEGLRDVADMTALDFEAELERVPPELLRVLRERDLYLVAAPVVVEKPAAAAAAVLARQTVERVTVTGRPDRGCSSRCIR